MFITGSRQRLSILGPALHNCSTLTELSLSGTRLKDNQIKWLKPLLSSSTSQLTSLSLAGNLIEDEGARELFSALRLNCWLQKLDLSVNSITIEGVRDLEVFTSDESVCQLKWLSLHSNQLGDSGLVHIAQLLSKNQTWLRCLHLGGNGDISVDTIKVLCAVEELRGFGWSRERVLWIAQIKCGEHWFHQLSANVMHHIIRWCARTIRITA